MMRRIVSSLLLSLTTGCFLLLEFEDKTDAGTGGAGASGAGASGAGASGAGASGAGGAGASGGQGGTGGQNPCGEGLFDRDPENCGGEGIRCGFNVECCLGVCEAVTTTASAKILEIGITPPNMSATDPITLGLVSPIPPLTLGVFLWSPSFTEGSEPLMVGSPTIPSPAGYVSTFRGGPGNLARGLVRPQSCPNLAPCMQLWSPNASSGTLTCNAAWSWPSLPGDHINGATWSNSQGYFLTTAPNMSSYELYQFALPNPFSNTDCAMPVEDLPTTVVATFQSSNQPSLLEVDPLTSELWWTTYDTGGCVYRHLPPKQPDPTPPALLCAVTPSDAFPMGSAKWTQAGLVLGSHDPTVPLRFVPRADLCPACPEHEVGASDEIITDTSSKLYPPFDTDENFIYARDDDGNVVAAVLRPGASTAEVRGSVEVEPSATLDAIEATEGVQVFFSTTMSGDQHTLVRWRKPPCSANPATCGDGCADPDEQASCDDGNDSNTDWCLDTCTLAACGDGFLWAGQEECDDDNNVGGDGCSPTCENE